jgi:hypothetical protein
VRQCLVDVIKFDATRGIISFNRLQTGDVSQERRSREATEDKNRIASFQLAG